MGVGKSAGGPCVTLSRAAAKELLILEVMYRHDENVSFIAENTSSYHISLRSKRFRAVSEQRKTRNEILGFGRARNETRGKK